VTTTAPTSGPLERALVDELREELRQHGIVFWLDKDAHYTGLVDRLRASHQSGAFPYPVVPFRGSYLEMMLALEPFANELVPERVLVHMPGHTEQSVRKTPMLELYEMGFRYRKALPTLIEQAATGLIAPDDVKALAARADLTLEGAERAVAAKLGERTGGLDAVLARMDLAQVVEAMLGGETDFSKTPEDAEVLAAYFHRHLGFVAADAERVLSGRPAPVPPEGREPTAKEISGWLRSQLAAWLLAMEFVHDLVRPPRTAALATLCATPAELVRRCRDLTEHVRKRNEELYARLAAEVGAAVAVADEAREAKPEDLGRVDTFKFEESVVLDGAIAGVLAGRWEPVLAWAADRAGDASFWLKRDHLRRCEWTLAEEAARLGKTIDAHAGALAGARTVEDALERYTTQAFEVDRAHRLFEQRWHDTKDPLLPHYAELLEIVEGMRRRYRDWADDTARAFTKLCEANGFLPDSSVQQRTLFDDVVRPLVAHGEPTAVFLLDALRYEMGAALADELRTEAAVTVDLKGRLAELPTITAVGMNALAPVAREGKLEPAVFGKGEIRGFRSGTFIVNDLETRARAMGERAIGQKARETQLAEVVDASPRKLKDWVSKGPQLIVVASIEIDGAGEAGFGLSTFEHTLRQVRNAWHKLSAAGVRNFVFTADHGFLLQDATTTVRPYGKKTDPDRRHVWSADAVRESGMVPVNYEKLGYKGADGYLLLREDTAVYETRNARAPFVHGGNSLEERVVPVLVVKRRRGPGQSTSAYAIEGSVERAVLGAHRVRVRVQLGTAATGSLGFTGVGSVRIALRAAGRDDIALRVRDSSGAGKLRGSELELPVGTEWTEVFFVLEGPADDRVQVEAFAASPVEEVKNHVFAEFFGVAGSSASPTVAAGTKRSEPPAASSSSETVSWRDHIADADFRRVFDHIAEHGSLSEADLIAMITARKARAFTREWDGMIGKLPFRVRIEVTGGQKIYLKDGGR
jgi:hypothetical protein